MNAQTLAAHDHQLRSGSGESPAAAPRGSASSHSSGKKRAGTEKYKIQIQLSEKAKDRLFELVEKTDAETAAQVVRDALRIYDILIDEMESNGNDLFLRQGASGDVVKLKLF